MAAIGHIDRASGVVDTPPKYSRMDSVGLTLVDMAGVGNLDPSPLYHELFSFSPIWPMLLPPSSSKTSFGALALTNSSEYIALSYDVAPPAYAVTLYDPPPAYTYPEASEQVCERNLHRREAELWTHSHLSHIRWHDTNLDTIPIIRERVSKKKKQEQKRAQAARWADSDGDSDDRKDDGSGGGVNGGSGGNTGTGGGQGSGDDDKDDKNWQMGSRGKKRMKKAKKTEGQDDDETVAEEDDEAPPKPVGNFWDNLMDAELDPDQEWGVATGKKKKGRKDKVSRSMEHVQLCD